MIKVPYPPPKWFVVLVLTCGILSISTGSILIRLANLAAHTQGIGFSLVIAASRLTLAALILLPAWSKIQWKTLKPRALMYAGAAGVCLAAHFAAWTTSLSYTSIAASTTLVTTNPIWVALLSWLWFKEKLTKITGIGIGIALSGGLMIAMSDTGHHAAGGNPLLGNILALIGAWAICLYFILGREAQQRQLGISGYIAIAYSVAALVLLPTPLIFGMGYTGYPKPVYLYLLLMAVVPQLVGHTSFNWAVRWMPPTFVTLTILLEPVGASILAYGLFNEVPSPWVFGGAVILLMGVAIAAMGSHHPSPNI